MQLLCDSENIAS